MGEVRTGVGAIICAAHNSSDGRLHGHTWEVTAWWPYAGSSALGLQARLGEAVARFDHGLLPDDLAWGEAIARYIGEELGCVAVDVSRPAERIYARWEA